MQDRQHTQLGFVQTRLPWVVAAAAFVVYLMTVNQWVTLGSLPYVAKVAGWDWTLPLTSPLFFVLTYPFRFLPQNLQPIALNLFAGACAAVTLALLARSVSLLPHDRTHAQRQRERSEFSLLTIPSAWLPPVFAVLVCGFQLTFWEHATAATNEALDLLVFAYLIRCLLEYRIDLRDSWIARFALVYGLGVTNNWALIAFAPLFLVALIWIRGFSFFDSGFLLRVTGFGLAGLCLYLLLPLVWALSTQADITFWAALKAELAKQKAVLLDTPALRNRVLVLSLTSLLPILIIGIRWPTSFGDTSAAGAALTNLMFRVIHVVFLGACLWIFFDQKFSPRVLGYGLPFLSFYYLSALAVGYFSGYILLVFTESRSKSRRRSSSSPLVDYLARGAVWLAAIGVPAGLAYKNLNVVWTSRVPVLQQFAEAAADSLPPGVTYIIGDEPYTLLLLQAHLSAKDPTHQNVLIHSRSLSVPEYHRALMRRYPNRIPDVIPGIPVGEVVDDATLLQMMTSIGSSNRIYYLHPSFGFYFERFYTRPHGLIHELVSYPTNVVFTSPPLDPVLLETNRVFWSKFETFLDAVQKLANADSRDARELAGYYSRALNYWGVELQKHQQYDEANQQFQRAVSLNTNNVPALVNVEYNLTLRTGTARTNEINNIIKDKLGLSNWDAVLVKNGPFDHPDFCFRLGQVFAQQTLFRQAASQFERVATLDHNYVSARLALADLCIKAGYPDEGLAKITDLRALATPVAQEPANQIELVRLEASAHFAQTNYTEAERVLLEAEKRFPNQLSVLDGLVMLYGQTQRYSNALEAIDKILRVSPDNVQAIVNQATVYFNSSNYTKAFDSLDRVLTRNSRNLQALLYKVFMLIETKEYDEASKALDRILEVDPENHEALLYQGVIAIETKQEARAIEPLTKLIKLQPPTATLLNALRNRAIAHLHNGDLNEAKADYERLRRHLPLYYPAYFGLAEIAYQRKNTADAIRYYELYLRQAPVRTELNEERQMVENRLNELRAAK